jgi:aminopeptidase N
MLKRARRNLVTLCAAFTLLIACSKPAPEPAVQSGPASGVDYHSRANTDDYRTTHIDLDFTVDFERRVLKSKAHLHLERLNEANNPLVLDTRGLAIESVRAGGDDEFDEVPFSLGHSSDDLGAPLTIEMPAGAKEVVIRYETSPDALALQWLEPQQTAGKRHPFLYTQAQSIHARSFIPLQDTPGVRITYDAVVRTPPALRAVMSADNDPDAKLDGEFSFSMPQPIPPYLVALAVGDLEFKAMGERTGVYAEEEILEAAAAEFADTEAMLETTEDSFGPEFHHADSHRRRQEPRCPDRARTRPFLVRQPGDQCQLARLVAKRGLHDLPHQSHHAGRFRRRTLPHGDGARLRRAD